MFSKFDGGRLNDDGDRRGRLYIREWEKFAIFDIILRDISVTLPDSFMVTADDY